MPVTWSDRQARRRTITPCESRVPSPPSRGSRPRPSPASPTWLQGRVHPLRPGAARRARHATFPAASRSCGPRTGSGSPTRLAAFAEFDGARPCVGRGYCGGGVIGATTVRLGRHFTVAAAPLPDRQRRRRRRRLGAVPPDLGRPDRPPCAPPGAAPAVRAVPRPVGLDHARARAPRRRPAEGRLVGASPFPRHWIYGGDGGLAAKSGMTDFKDWAGHAFGRHTPWGDEDSPALVAAVETALERELSNVVMRGGPSPSIRSWQPGRCSPRRARRPTSDPRARRPRGGRDRRHELGRGGAGRHPRRAGRPGRRPRTATFRAVTPVRAATVPAAQLDRDQLAVLAAATGGKSTWRADAHRRAGDEAWRRACAAGPGDDASPADGRPRPRPARLPWRRCRAHARRRRPAHRQCTRSLHRRRRR